MVPENDETLMNEMLLTLLFFLMVSHSLISLVVLSAGAFMLHRVLAPKQEPQRHSGTGVFRTVKTATGIKLEPVTDAEPQPGQTPDEALDEWLMKSAS